MAPGSKRPSTKCMYAKEDQTLIVRVQTRQNTNSDKNI